MKKVLILVEGQTEETVVRDVLSPYFGSRDTYLDPIILKTKREKWGTSFKGGVRSFDQVRRDLLPLLGDTSAAAVTTLIDYYGLPQDFPGMDSRPVGDCHARVQHVESAFTQTIKHPRFIPHLTLHELEAWVFVAPQKCAWLFRQNDFSRKLEEIRQSCGGPENINEDPKTAPSKRILRIAEDYQKAWQGPRAIAEIGMDAIRKACPHADTWLRRIESL
jgi:hypothetical protein